MNLIEALREVVFPLFLTLGIILRVLGAAGFGAVMGAVLKAALEREDAAKYLIPVVFAVTGVVFAVMGVSNGGNLGGLDVSAPGSPGTLGAFGMGTALSFFLLGRNREE
jgi:hypothetical protein